MHRVKDVMTDEVQTCGPEDTLEAAVEIMRNRGCCCVPVVDARERVVGLLTDRDAVICALQMGKRLSDIRVGEACSRGVITCDCDDALDRAEQLMRVNRVRRLPVLGRDRVLVGVISLTDLARHMGHSAAGSTSLSPKQIAAVLAETSGVRRRVAPGGHRRDPETGAHPIIEHFFHG